MRLRFGLQEEKIYSLREIGSMLNIPAKHIRDIELRDVNRLVSNQRLNAVKIDGN